MSQLDSKAALEQASPMHQRLECPDVTELVHADLEARHELGMRKYGISLKPFDGRQTLWDAYQEVLDLAHYLRKEIYERYGE